MKLIKHSLLFFCLLCSVGNFFAKPKVTILFNDNNSTRIENAQKYVFGHLEDTVEIVPSYEEFDILFFFTGEAHFINAEPLKGHSKRRFLRDSKKAKRIIIVHTAQSDWSRNTGRYSIKGAVVRDLDWKKKQNILLINLMYNPENENIKNNEQNKGAINYIKDEIKSFSSKKSPKGHSGKETKTRLKALKIKQKKLEEEYENLQYLLAKVTSEIEDNQKEIYKFEDDMEK